MPRQPSATLREKEWAVCNFCHLQALRPFANMRRRRKSALAASVRIVWLCVVVMLIAMVLGGVFFRLGSPMNAQSHTSQPTSDDVFTPEHKTASSAAREFFGWRQTPVQPIAFTHQVHLQKGL